MTDEFGNEVFDSPWDGEVATTDSSALAYYKNKVAEFQEVLVSLDRTYVDLVDIGNYVYAANDADAIAEYEALISQFDSRRAAVVGAAEAVQLATQGANALGLNLPTVQVPIGLAGLPALPLIALAGAAAGAVTIIAFSKDFFASVRDYVQRMQHLDAIRELPEVERAAAIAALRKTEAQASEALALQNRSPITAFSDGVKWLAIAGVAYFAYKAWSESRHGNR
jgi:hypothetical protein